MITNRDNVSSRLTIKCPFPSNILINIVLECCFATSPTSRNSYRCECSTCRDVVSQIVSSNAASTHTNNRPGDRRQTVDTSNDSSEGTAQSQWRVPCDQNECSSEHTGIPNACNCSPDDKNGGGWGCSTNCASNQVYYCRAEKGPLGIEVRVCCTKRQLKSCSLNSASQSVRNFLRPSWSISHRNQF